MIAACTAYFNRPIQFGLVNTSSGRGARVRDAFKDTLPDGSLGTDVAFGKNDRQNTAARPKSDQAALGIAVFWQSRRYQSQAAGRKACQRLGDAVT